MFSRTFVMLVSVLWLATVPAQARDLTFVSWGGPYQEAEKKAFLQPFTEATGIRVVEDTWQGEMARVRSQIQTKALIWDVVNASGASIITGCDEGLFEKLDWSRISRREEFVPAAVLDCGVGIMAGGTILTYDKERFKPGPSSWADMWNVQTWPGARGILFNPRYALELALLADGVPRKQLYEVLRTPAGVDRAFAKLDKLKPNIRWWRSGSELVQLLASGELAVASAYYGRIQSMNLTTGRNFAIVREAGTLQEFGYYAVLRGSPNLEGAYKLLAFATQPQILATYPKFYPYGVAKPRAYELMDPKVRATLLSPIGVDENTIFIDEQFWVENLQALQERFNTWAARR